MDITDWQLRSLLDQYTEINIDLIHYKVRQESKMLSNSCMLILGIGMSGKQAILSMGIIHYERASALSGVLDDLKGIGVNDILFLYSDNLNGLNKVIETIVLNSAHHICIVHQISSTLKYVSYKDRKAIVKEVKGIYPSSNQEMAKQELDQFKEKWGYKYHASVNSWEQNWDTLTAFLSDPQEIRKLIYISMIIESFNGSLIKFTKNKMLFSTDHAVLKSIYFTAMQITSKWKKLRFEWAQIYNQIYIHFENRINLSL